ncbi:MAG: sporulation transcriptional regulator SpoIIID [Lachnospiraceae bacterium]|nr:sporulation transcriptional regulator SpoIIID [Lachnospiraceae bacterium]
MWEEIGERAKACGEYIVKTGCTVRACAERYGISKSTVHTVVI